MTKKGNFLFFFLTLTLFIAHTNVKGKVFQGTFNIKKNGKINYLTKFSCNIGTCQFKIKMKLKDNIYAKLLHNYYKLNSILLDDKENNKNNNFFNMNYDNAYNVLTSNNLEFSNQRITLMLDIEQKYVSKNEKCFTFGKLRNVHKFNIPFNFKYYDLVNSKTYDNLKKFINNKYSISFNKIYSELKNNKLMQSEILNITSLGNESNSNYENKDISANTTHRVHVWFLMFDDCYDSLINNLKLSIKTKVAYWEYLLQASKMHDISSLAYASSNNDSKFYSSNKLDKKTLIKNPKRLLFLEKNFTKAEIEDISFFIKHHNFENMKSFVNLYNNLYKNGFYEKIIDHIFENDGFTVEYEVNIFQTNKSHFSYELQYSPILTFILTILYIFLIFKYGSKIIQNVVTKKYKHGMVLCVASVIFIQLLSNSLLFIHLLVYSKNGIGIQLFKISFNLLNFLVQIVMCTMLLSLSYGLTIFESSVNVFIRIKVIFVLITFFHIILVILDNTYIMESSSKYFDNDNITGYIIVFLRVMLAIVYHININNLFSMSKIPPIRSFLKKVYIFGLFYILSFPIIFMICYIFDTYWRQRCMIFGTAFLQFVSIYFITKMFLTNSEYFKVSDMSASALPGATSSWFNQKFHAY